MELVLIDREALLTELRQVFDVKTAETLLRVLDEVAAQVRQAGVTREDFSELKQAVLDVAEQVKKLTDAQTRSEARLDRVEAAIERLTEAQARTDARVAALIEAQARSEEWLKSLEGSHRSASRDNRETRKRDRAITATSWWIERNGGRRY